MYRSVNIYYLNCFDTFATNDKVFPSYAQIRNSDPKKKYEAQMHV